MRSFFLITGLIFNIVLLGCQPSRVITSDNVEHKVTSAVVEEKITTNKAVKKDSLSKFDMSVVKEEVIRTTTNIKYSQPDSTGKQYALEQTVTQEKTSQETNANVTEKVGTSNEQVSSSYDVNRSKSDAAVKTSSDAKTITKPPLAFTWMILIISLGLVVLTYFILKRFRLVK